MPDHGDNRCINVASEVLAAGLTSRHQVAALAAVIACAETAMANPSIDTSHVACGPGCGTCCCVNVNILEPEALAISDYVDQTFSSSQRNALISRLSELDRATRWLDDEERMMSRLSCAFLDPTQHCSIHPVRPLLCRSVTSTDPQRCKDAVALLALGEPPEIICQLTQQSIYHDAYLGLSAAMTSHGLNSAPARLTGRLLELIDN